ncbi:BamA/TamA family outer membrane protein [Bdellovibrio sp. GT3]|uniref:BamA/TamA family outer membrane protein n=1 Tax=Bdellovibrio sp. GT3 TaxID=3136282 RepID=UPI0030F09886
MSVKFIALFLTFFLVAGASFGQEKDTDSGDYGSDVDDFDEHNPPAPDPSQRAPLEYKPQKTKNELVVAPIPNYNPAQGWGLALMAQNIFSTTPGVKPSTGFAAIFGTQKESYGAMAGYLGRMNEDRWRLNIFGGYVRINSDFYGVGEAAAERDQSVLMHQNVTFVNAQWMPRLTEGFYLGLTVGYSKMETSFDADPLPSGVTPDIKLDDDSWLPGFKGQYDSRNNTFYPTQGIFSNFQGQFYDKNLGGGHTFQRYRLNYSQYFGMFTESALAVRVATEANVGDVPFYKMAVFGRGRDMRGYKAGQYRDNILWAAQTEYRQRFTDRWGFVVFGGFGDVVGKASELTLTNLLWAGGTGIRFRMARQNPVDFRVDVAYGDDWATYVSVNQAF